MRVFHGISSTVSSQVRIQLASGDWSELRSSLAASFSAASSHLLRQVRGLDPGPVVLFLGARLAVQLGQLLADRRELLAQQELALLLLHALADVVLDGLGHVQLGQRVAGPAGQQLQALLGVDRLQQLGLLLEA